MALRFDLAGIVVGNMARSLAFYRLLGLDIPASDDGEPHVEVDLAGGVRLAWDTVDVVRSFDPGWTPPVGGHRIALAFACESAAEVDETYAVLIAAKHHSGSGHRTQTAQMLVAQPKQGSRFFVMGKFYDRIRH